MVNANVRPPNVLQIEKLLTPTPTLNICVVRGIANEQKFTCIYMYVPYYHFDHQSP
jgi:hypothetical protein